MYPFCTTFISIKNNSIKHSKYLLLVLNDLICMIYSSDVLQLTMIVEK